MRVRPRGRRLLGVLGFCTRDEPAALERVGRPLRAGFFAASACMLIGFGIAKNVSTQWGQGSPLFQWFLKSNYLIFYPITLFLVVILCYHYVKLRRQVERGLGYNCLNCAFRMGPEDGRCPECGEPYSASEAQAAWRRSELRPDLFIPYVEYDADAGVEGGRRGAGAADAAVAREGDRDRT